MRLSNKMQQSQRSPAQDYGWLPTTFHVKDQLSIQCLQWCELSDCNLHRNSTTKEQKPV